ncbi:uncharacterized protein STAUR_2232 [Stigmatella aurantiaca DW4/3-1]|uniref:Uncharacterized protein n=1 Tax=Stigmatella aurantiaca (strain DW4/3-1) TaxID=378806 RepID=E3FCB3_STIAD|nr:uncharacterized protein STAUR_2232 [Stigmatella aurantiaca DW4/3-1]
MGGNPLLGRGRLCHTSPRGTRIDRGEAAARGEGAGPAGKGDAGRTHRVGPPHPPGAAGGGHPVRAMHGQAGEPRDPRPLPAVPRRAGLCRGPAPGRRAVHPDVRPVPGQGEEHRRGGPGAGARARLGGAALPGGAGATAGRGPQDGGGGVHPPGRRHGVSGGYPCEPAGEPAGLHPAPPSGQGGGRSPGLAPLRAVEDGPPTARLAWPTHVLCALTRLRALCRGRAVPKARGETGEG